MVKKLTLSDFQEVRATGMDESKRLFSFNSSLSFDDVLMTSSVGLASIEIPADADLNSEIRKMADKDIEIFVNGESIGFGALNHGVGMTAEQLAHDAATPEAD